MADEFFWLKFTVLLFIQGIKDFLQEFFLFVAQEARYHVADNFHLKEISRLKVAAIHEYSVNLLRVEILVAHADYFEERMSYESCCTDSVRRINLEAASKDVD